MSIKILPLVHVLLAALGGIVATASNPDYYAWIIIPLFCFMIAYKVLVSPNNRKLLSFSFVAIGLYSFVVGRIFFDGNALRDDGLLLLIVTLPIAAFTIIRICLVEVSYSE